MQRTIKLYLRLAIAAGFLSAVADRLGFWSVEMSIWGNWESFLAYTQLLNPWVSAGWIPAIGFILPAAEVVFASFLLVGFKTELCAVLSGVLLLLFALSMIFSTAYKGVFQLLMLLAS